MRLRSLALPILALGLVVAPSAEGAAKKLCNMHSDPANDQSYYVFLANDSKALDILGGDVATGKNELVAVLRVGSTNTANDTWSKLGYKWSFAFSAGGADFSFVNSRSGGGVVPGGKQFDSPSVTIGGAPVDAKTVTFVVDAKTNSFIWKVPRKGIKALAKPKLAFTTFRSSVMANGGNADNASTNNTKYPDRALSCVAAK